MFFKYFLSFLLPDEICSCSFIHFDDHFVIMPSWSISTMFSMPTINVFQHFSKAIELRTCQNKTRNKNQKKNIARGDGGRFASGAPITLNDILQNTGCHLAKHRQVKKLLFNRGSLHFLHK